MLRSDDLASNATRDAAFLNALRSRLADEPVPLAPQALMPAPARPHQHLDDVAAASAPQRRRSQWLVAPAAVAAGFVAVAAVLVLVRGAGSSVDAPVLAGGSLPAATATGLAQADADVLRKAGFERYLEAHRKVSNGMGALMPAGSVRSADLVTLDAK